jgi:hypothetical protein
MSQSAGGKAGFRLAVASLVLLGGAAVWGTLQAFLAGLPDWYMHLGIWTVLLAYSLLYINATNLGRPLRAAVNYLLFTGLGLFWMRILFTLIPTQPMLVEDNLIQRAALPGLAVVAGLLGLTQVLLLLHFVFFLVRRKPAPAAKTEPGSGDAPGN